MTNADQAASPVYTPAVHRPAVVFDARASSEKDATVDDNKKRREQKLREEMKKKGRGKPELREVDDFEVKKKAEKAAWLAQEARSNLLEAQLLEALARKHAPQQCLLVADDHAQHGRRLLRRRGRWARGQQRPRRIGG